jgi:hypothetical protein
VLHEDNIFICSVCEGNSIAYCNDTETDMNRQIKDAVAENPDRRGGKISKQKSHKFSKKTRKSKRRFTRK